MAKSYRILITGGAGFIGSNLCEFFLKDNHYVTCLDNFSTGFKKNIESFLDHPKFKLIEGDITNHSTCVQSVKSCDYVLHHAALGSVPRSIKDPISTNSSNVVGFLNLLTAAKDNGIKRFVYAASSSTYGDDLSLPKKEERIGKPLSPYAVSKYINELYAEVFGKTYTMQTIGLRYFNVFGKNQNPQGAYAAVIPKFILKMINQQQPTINGSGDISRDFTYIENVIQANKLALICQNPKAINEVYNIACGDKTSLNSLFKMIQDLWDINFSCNMTAESAVPFFYKTQGKEVLFHTLFSLRYEFI